MTPDAMKFDNANNACLSLRVIAEMVRTGEAAVTSAQLEGKEVLVLKISTPRKR